MNCFLPPPLVPAAAAVAAAGAAAAAAGAAAAAAAESVGLPMLWRGGVSRMGVPFGTRVAMAVAIQGSRLIR